jgi:hypothetical protein
MPSSFSEITINSFDLVISYGRRSHHRDIAKFQFEDQFQHQYFYYSIVEIALKNPFHMLTFELTELYTLRRQGRW